MHDVSYVAENDREFLILLPPLPYTGIIGVYQVYCKMFCKTLKLYLDWYGRWS